MAVLGLTADIGGYLSALESLESLRRVDLTHSSTRQIPLSISPNRRYVFRGEHAPPHAGVQRPRTTTPSRSDVVYMYRYC